MRLMWDSVTANSIPAGVGMVAGYVDGKYRWSDADWNRFGGVKVRIAIWGTTNDGHVLDVEPGNHGPADYAVCEWVKKRRAAGIEPTIYTPVSWWDDLIRSFNAWAVKPPQFWVAHWNNDRSIPDGCVAKQFNDPNTGSGGHWDMSSVRDFWPGVEGQGNPSPGGGGGGVPIETGWEYYTVVAGDTLSGIGERFGVSYHVIAELNGITNVNLIYPGQRLKVRKLGHNAPAPVPTDRGWYTIAYGDTLSGLAARWGTSVDAISRLNGISNPNKIYANQRIRIPA